MNRKLSPFLQSCCKNVKISPQSICNVNCQAVWAAVVKKNCGSKITQKAVKSAIHESDWVFNIEVQDGNDPSEKVRTMMLILIWTS
jgi:hypothetical protein